ncbi:DUF6893 family small protein [Actinoallomurus rhizosphaericola]
MIKKVLIGAAVAGVVVVVIRELPALRREIKIWRM